MKQQLSSEEQKAGGSDNSDGEKFLYQLNKVLYKFNTTKLDHDLVTKLGQFSQKILEKRRKVKGYQPSRPATRKEPLAAQQTNKLTSSPSEIIEEYDESMESSLRRSTQMRRSGKIKPSYLKNLSTVFSAAFLSKVRSPVFTNTK